VFIVNSLLVSMDSYNTSSPDILLRDLSHSTCYLIKYFSTQALFIQLYHYLLMLNNNKRKRIRFFSYINSAGDVSSCLHTI